MAQIESILTMPMTGIIRLMGSAILATGKKRSSRFDRSKTEEGELLALLESKARKAGLK